MNQLKATKATISRHIWILFLLQNIIFGLSLYLCITYLSYRIVIDFVIAGAVALVFLTIISLSLSKFIIQPLAALRQAILHISPRSTRPIKAPVIKDLGLGRQLVTNLTNHLYEIAKVGYRGAIKDGTINKRK